MTPASTPTEPTDVPLEDLSYEQAIAELESIVAALETGDRTLEAALELYERGQALARYCTRLLDQAELKIQSLSGDELVDFNPQ